jgi:hypothetical protein
MRGPQNLGEEGVRRCIVAGRFLDSEASGPSRPRGGRLRFFAFGDIHFGVPVIHAGRLREGGFVEIGVESGTLIARLRRLDEGSPT